MSYGDTVLTLTGILTADPEYRARALEIFDAGRRKAKENADHRKQVMR